MRRRTTVFLGAVLALLVMGPVARADLYVQGYDAKLHDRFYTGADKAFIGQSFDWSGVGQASDGTWGTMISPTYFVSANHYHPGAGTTLTFYEDNTTLHPHTYTVDSWSAHNGDLFLGRLTAAIPASDHITFYPILSLPSENDYLGREILVNGKPDRIGRNIISNMTFTGFGGPVGSEMSYRYDTYGNGDTLGADEAYLVGGDSGGPSFTVSNGALDLLGTHYWNFGSPPPSNGWMSGDSFVPYSINWLDSNMVGEQLTIVTDSYVPEPATLTLVILGAFGLILRRRA